MPNDDDRLSTRAGQLVSDGVFTIQLKKLIHTTQKRMDRQSWLFKFLLVNLLDLTAGHFGG